MTVGGVPASGFFADFSSLATGFQSAALGDAEVAGILYLLEGAEPSDRVFLSTHTALESLFPAYRQAVAKADRSEMQRLGSLIARNIRAHHATFDRLLGERRFASSAKDVVAALKPHAAAEEAAKTPATVAMMSAAEYLEGLKALEGEYVDSSMLGPPSVFEDWAGIAGLTFLVGGAFEFFRLRGLLEIGPPSITGVYKLLGTSALLFGYAVYKFLILRKPHQYARLRPLALYDRKTGEVLAPTLARFKQGAVPLYPVDKKDDAYTHNGSKLPLGSYVLLRGVRMELLNPTNDNYPNFSFMINFSEKGEALFVIYKPKTDEEAKAVKAALRRGPVTFIGRVIPAELKFRDIQVVRILPEPTKTK